MPRPEDRNTHSQWPQVRGALRWLVAGAIGAAVTLSLFVAMAAAIDGVDIAERLFRIFPLKQVAASATDECAAGGAPPHLAVPIEGVVGRLRDDQLAPLSDVIAMGDNAITGATPVDVSSDGSFRFVAAFRDDAPSTCPESRPAMEDAPQQLTFRAAGCVERIIPVTAAWVPHTVLLDCTDRD